MRATPYILNLIITATTLLIFERVFAFSKSNLQFEAWLLIAALFFFYVGLLVFLGGSIGLLFNLIKDHKFLKWLKPVFIAGASFVPFYVLGSYLSQGNWIKAQSWVDYFPPAMAACATLGALIGIYLFDRIRGSKYQVVFGCLGILVAIGLLYFQAKISGGVYHYVYLAIYFLSTIVLSLSVVLLNLSTTFKKTSYAVLAVLLAGCIFTIATTNNTMRANADLNSLTFSNLTRVLLPAQKLSFLEKVLVGNSAIVPPKIPEVKTPIGNKDWNVLFVVVDTLRADIFEPWRRGDITTEKDTPFMDSFFKDAIHFERGYAQGSGTVVSMPSLFRSLEVNEKTTKYGRPIGKRFSEHDFKTFAVVNNFFVEPRFLRTRSLLDGFEDVKVYQKRTQEDLLTLTREALDRYQNEQWFAWVHFYNMHHTAFDGKFLKGVPKKEAYRRAAGWLDSQMKALVDDLKAKKLLSKTIIVFTADHGESFGDNGIHGHGRSIWEEEVRAPIAIRIPGVKGKKVPGTVGNIDLLPTLLDLLKLPADPTLAGRSLVPFIANGESIPDHSYYLTNLKRSQTAIVRGSDKLVFKAKKGILQRFDLDTDPEETVDLFFASGSKELRMRRDLVFHEPSTVKKELKIPAMKKLLLQQIENVADDDHESSLFYAKLVAQSPSVPAVKALSKKIVSKNNRHFSQHYRVLCRTKQARAIRNEMQKRIENTTSRKEMLRGIVDLYCPSFSDGWVFKMMKAATPDERKYWLSLSLQYTNKQQNKLLSLMNKWLTDSTLGAQERRLIYENITKIRVFEKKPESLAENVRKGLNADELSAESAIRAIGNLRDKDAAPALIAMLEKTKSIRIKQVILMSLGKIKADNAFDIITKKMKEESVLTFDGAKALMELGDKRGLKVLDKYGRSYPNSIVRGGIKKFAKKLRKKIAKEKKKTKK